MDDPRITHELVDRPGGPSDVRRLGRAYVQPQWVYDCLNAAELLPITQYLPGATLPPHLSPFEQKPPILATSTDAMATGTSLAASAAAGAGSASATADSSSARRPAADDGDSQEEANEDENGPAEVDDDDDEEQMGNARSDEEAETLESQESKAASKEAELLNASGSSVQRKRTANMAVLSGV